MEEQKQSETKYELMMYQLVIVVLVGVFVALGIGFWAGKSVGFSKGVDAIRTEIPDYCTINKQGSELSVKCNELGLGLDDVCRITTPGFRSKVKVVSLGEK
jgi:hypothetical protein